MFLINQYDHTPPGTFAEELAKAALKYPVRADVDPEIRLQIFGFFARVRMKVQDTRKRPSVRAAAPDAAWDYAKYLHSSRWKQIRGRVMVRDQWCCARCDGEATEVHHRNYAPAVMEGRDDSQLACLCDGCHEVVEFRPDGSRNSGTEKEARLLEKDTRHDFPEPKIDLRRTCQKLPQDWKRMNHWQKEGWQERKEWLINERLRIRHGIPHPNPIKPTRAPQSGG